MGGNLVKIFLASMFGLGFMLSTSVFSDVGVATSADPININAKGGGKINNTLRREAERSLGKLANFDANNNKVMEIIAWDGMAGQGMIVATREGIGRSSGCAIYEKIGDSDFEFVNGQPFFWFSNPSGESNKNSSSIKFTGKIRQSYDGPLNDMWFELFYDRRAGIFCDPSSRSKKFTCSNGLSGQGGNKSSDGK
ncbi:hypothetical protein KDW10_25965 [Burkholderia vietnamiensis]|uniref:hypothetical protein n=1 Tax=Burkholderia vietnamiensis TaxID=60552 RepID=UPI001B92A6AC|nr:hypothetical protein [Burkholderia vietnamiensis]MBR8360778.1 hypothetical protein [Burkholderia vietnamiensis]